MSSWKHCREYGFWINLAHIRRITIDRSNDEEIYFVIAHDEETSIIIYCETKEKCEEWLKEFMMDELFDISNGHKDLKEDEIRFFGEWVYWDNQEDLDDAYKFLALWKKFHLKRLSKMEQEGPDQIVLRPAMYEQSLGGMLPNMGRGTLGIKIAMKVKKNA